MFSFFLVMVPVIANKGEYTVIQLYNYGQIKMVYIVVFILSEIWIL